ncbi:hypothetical protein [Kingella kingae]|nr:hypothetical protein [Kingella kingae]
MGFQITSYRVDKENIQ